MFSHMKIAAKIYGLAAILLVLTAITTGYSLYAMNQLGSELESVAEQDMPITEAITRITVHQLEQAILFEQGINAAMQIASEPAARERFLKIEAAYAELGHKVKEELLGAEELVRSSIEAAHTEADRVEYTAILHVLDKIDKEYGLYEDAAEQIFLEVEHGNTDSLQESARQLEHQEEIIDRDLKEVLFEIETFTEHALLAAKAHEHTALWVQLVLMVIALGLGTALAHFITRNIVSPILAMTAAMERLAGGDLELTVPAQDNQDEVGEMARAVQVFKDSALENKRLEVAAEESRAKIEDQRAQVEADREQQQRAAEVAERDIQAIIDAIRHGELSQRIDLKGKEGFSLSVREGVNELAGTSEQVINDTVRILSAMARGDLNERIENDYSGQYDTLKNDANATVKKLVQVVTEIQQTSMSVKSAAQELASGNTSLSQRTEEQASSLEQTSSAMAEMTATVQQNADNAKEANKLAHGAHDRATTGGEVVSQAIAAMAEISESSKKITDIIRVIDDIAFQTNLLALNASVEAARARDQGRGFAVVATEVRNLAGRSATAAKEIKELIEDSERKVGEGSALVNKSGETLGEIVDAVKKVTDIVSEITHASAEQATGLEEVNKAMSQMDAMTQQNAALVEQAAAASESIGTQAANLESLISFFELGGGAQSELSEFSPQSSIDAQASYSQAS